MKSIRPLTPAAWVCALVVLTPLVACDGEESSADAAAPAVTVELGRAIVRDYAVTVTALGSVVSRAGGAARVSAPGESVVTAIHVAPGDIVQSGTPLVDLDRSVWLEQAREADAALAAANEARDRIQRLVERGILPTKDLEAATAEQARTRAAAAAAHRTLTRSTLRAPIPGVVTSVAAAVSQPVASADVLVEITDLGALDVLVRLTPEAAAQVAPGDSVALFAGLEGRPEPFGTGTVRGVSSEISPETGTVLARVTLSSSTRPGRVGLTLSAGIVVDRHEGAVVVPRRAIVPVTDGAVIYVVDDSGVAHETTVVPGASDADSVEIVSGLSGREQIVTGGAYAIVDGAHVQAASAP